jgi:hypothetical protein
VAGKLDAVANQESNRGAGIPRRLTLFDDKGASKVAPAVGRASSRVSSRTSSSWEPMWITYKMRPLAIERFV